ncbi:hypothetical protein [Stenomitos frigidus]|uniref:Uncharacterized protein n=1 Tax=Stenomitos frigidus ULC18 TaxID=2107698 RepID=A0A2T1DTA0_9CYAN|nr:hypothetical protein [Stenomitos frigidus]PSB23739.1 hypothetical protein C7B82_29855 [Stenomitos frigidus ULC18]
MLITDLDYLEATTESSEYGEALPEECFITGAAASAFVTGYTTAGTGYAAAGVLASASGQQTFGTTNTLATTSLYPYYTTSNATASGRALGISPYAYAGVGFYGSSNNTSFNGNSTTINSSVTYSTYRTW